MASFGEQLRQERERKGMQLEDVSLATKVGTRFLRALEEERLDQLPGGIFNKGFIRAYAQHLGLDDNEIVAEYLAIVEEKTSAAAAPAGQPGMTERSSTRDVPRQESSKKGSSKNDGSQKESLRRERSAKKRPPLPSAPLVRPTAAFHVPTEANRDPADRIPWGKLAIVLLIVAFAFALWGSFSRQSWPPKKLRTEKPAPAQAATQGSEPASQNAVSSSPPQAARPEPRTPAPMEISASPGPAGVAQRSPVTPAAQITDSETTVPPARGAFVVLIQAKEDCWLQITVDGREIMQDLLPAYHQKAVSAQKEMVIKAGNVGGIEFSFNGRKLPVQGEEDEVKTLTFGAQGLEVTRKPLETQTGRPQA